MSAITVTGGVYHERCIWPDWDQVYGSGGRAAAALSAHVDQVTLQAYARADTADRFNSYAATTYGFRFEPVDASQTISFEYVHSLSVPTIRPTPALIQANTPFEATDKVVVRFGMMEGSARVEAISSGSGRSSCRRAPLINPYIVCMRCSPMPDLRPACPSRFSE